MVHAEREREREREKGCERKREKKIIRRYFKRLGIEGLLLPNEKNKSLIMIMGYFRQLRMFNQRFKRHSLKERERDLFTADSQRKKERQR